MTNISLSVELIMQYIRICNKQMCCVHCHDARAVLLSLIVLVLVLVLVAVAVALLYDTGRCAAAQHATE